MELILLHNFRAGEFRSATLMYRKSRSINDLIQDFEKGTGGTCEFSGSSDLIDNWFFSRMREEFYGLGKCKSGLTKWCGGKYL